MTKPLDRDLLILIHDLARIMRTRFDQRARTHDMTRAQWLILARLDRQPGLSQNEMAALCEVEPITVARLVDRLETRGLVERRSDPSDRRIRRLHLLAAARPLLAEIANYREEMNAELTRGIAPDVMEEVIDTLLTMKDRLTSNDASLSFVTAGE